MVIKVEVTGIKGDGNEEKKEYAIQLPIEAEGTDATSFVNDLLAGALWTGPYKQVTRFRVSGMHPYSPTWKG